MEPNKNKTVWALIGVSEETRILAKKMAKQERMSIGEWVENKITNQNTYAKQEACWGEDVLSRQIENVSRKLEEVMVMINKPKKGWFGG